MLKLISKINIGLNFNLSLLGLNIDIIVTLKENESFIF